jgi:hypothetical protein
MRKRIEITVALALFLTGIACMPRAAAQETPKEGEAQLRPTGSYKVEFTVNELENGKKINARSYSARLNANTLPQWTGWQQTRVGSRVPFAVEAGKFEYVDIGMNIDCRLMSMGGSGYVVVGANWEYSSVAGERIVSQNTQNPVIRHVSSQVEAVVPLDKPTVISEVDDVASTHHYVFEVKVTKITP